MYVYITLYNVLVNFGQDEKLICRDVLVSTEMKKCLSFNKDPHSSDKHPIVYILKCPKVQGFYTKQKIQNYGSTMDHLRANHVYAHSQKESICCQTIYQFV